MPRPADLDPAPCIRISQLPDQQVQTNPEWAGTDLRAKCDMLRETDMRTHASVAWPKRNTGLQSRVLTVLRV